MFGENQLKNLQIFYHYFLNKDILNEIEKKD